MLPFSYIANVTKFVLNKERIEQIVIDTSIKQLDVWQEQVYYFICYIWIKETKRINSTLYGGYF
jgi:hypothetical protein